MKVSELFEAKMPAINPKLGYSTQAKIPLGGTKEWLKTFGATETDISQAMRVVRQSNDYRSILKFGLTDESSDRNDKNGSIAFIGQFTNPQIDGKQTLIKITVQANGKVDIAQNRFTARAPLSTPKPRIVPGDAVSSISKSMQASLEKVAAYLERRVAEGKKIQAAVKKTEAKK